MFLEIISPEKIIYSGEVTSVAVPGVQGEFEMLNNHAAIVSTLKKGHIKIDISLDKENLCISIHDNGIGVDFSLANIDCEP